LPLPVSLPCPSYNRLAMSPALRITGIYQPFAGAPLEIAGLYLPGACGLPFPADDHLDGTLDLNKRYIAYPAATFFIFTDSDSMKDAVSIPATC